MPRTRHQQRNLFDEAASVMPLQPDLRSKLAPLLGALLAEAAGVTAFRDKPDHRGGEEGGDDQDRG
jgi:hypothetical protein